MALTEAAADSAGRLERMTAQAALHPAHGITLLPDRLKVDGTLRRLYETSLVMFAERGYHAVSVRDLTSAVGVRPSALYAHVPGKATLLAELLRIGHEEHLDRVRSALLGSGPDPDEQIAAVMGAHVRMHLTFPLLARVCNRELGALPPPLCSDILAVRTETNQLFMHVIERGQKRGDFAPADPILAVAAIGAMGIRVAEWWRSDLGLSADQVEATYVQFARKLLAP